MPGVGFIRPAGGGGGGASSLSVGLSDTTPTFGDNITITATPTGFTPTNYLFILLSSTDEPTFLAEQASNVLIWQCVSTGTQRVLVFGSDDGGVSWVGNEISAAISSDSDADAFILAAEITDDTERIAIYNLTVGLKADGVFAKCHAIYPFVGSVASQHKYNLINPLDTDGAFRLSFLGGGTHSTDGYQLNGTNAYADTFLNDNTTMLLDDSHISIYSRTDTDGLYVDIGVLVGTATANIVPKLSNIFYPRMHATNSGIANATSSLGLFVSNRVGSTEVRGFQNGVLKQVAGASVGLANATYNIGRMAGSATFYSPREIAFASIGTGLTDAEGADMHTTVQAFQTELNRNV